MNARIIDLTGRRFGRLTVLRPAADAERRVTVSRDSQWRCRCDCGREVTQTAGTLRSGSAVTCGCGPRGNGRPPLDLTGRRFGLLTVEGRDDAREGYSRWYALWRCRCDCGGTATAPTEPLTAGRVGSCGCRGDGPRPRGRPHHDLAGRRFGALTAVRSAGRGDPDGSHLWVCRCDCGRDVEASARRLRRLLKGARGRECGCGTGRACPPGASCGDECLTPNP